MEVTFLVFWPLRKFMVFLWRNQMMGEEAEAGSEDGRIVLLWLRYFIW